MSDKAVRQHDEIREKLQEVYDDLQQMTDAVEEEGGEFTYTIYEETDADRMEAITLALEWVLCDSDYLSY